MSEVMPSTPWNRTWSAIRNASTIGVLGSATWSSRSFGTTIRVSTAFFSSVMPMSAWVARLRPSKPNGRVTTPIVSAPRSRAISATTGAPPVPVPPPSPAVMNTMSAPLRISSISSRVLARRRCSPTSGSEPGAEAPRGLPADVELHLRVGHEQRLGVGVDGDELDAPEACLDHPVHRVHAAATDADDLDHGEVVLGSIHLLAFLRTPGPGPVTWGNARFGDDQL